MFYPIDFSISARTPATGRNDWRLPIADPQSQISNCSYPIANFAWRD